MVSGYDQPLYILPFDHRHSFVTGVFHWQEPLAPEQVAEIVSSKQVIYDGFKAAVDEGIPHNRAGILVDEQFGAAILREAQTRGYVTCVSTEKSGQDEFDFEYGDAFAHHIEEVNPTFAKVLVRYNPEGDSRATIQIVPTVFPFASNGINNPSSMQGVTEAKYGKSRSGCENSRATPHHSGLSYLTPADVHYGRRESLAAAREYAPPRSSRVVIRPAWPPMPRIPSASCRARRVWKWTAR
jgi:hypothetical protein